MPDRSGIAAPAPSQARLDEERAASTRLAIASSVFFVLLASALLIGGHAALDPLLRSAAAARETARTGDVMLTMPDGIFCRHMSFDNTTAEVREGGLEPCPDSKGGHRTRSTTGFAWGAQ